MAEITKAWPVKRREMQNHHFDSTVWNAFNFRDGDVVIATYGKSGTTWTQQIVGQILSDGAGDIAINESSLWLDLRVPPNDEKLSLYEAQVGRRFMKTHLPVDALVFSPKAKYIYVGRDGRDVLWSLHHHHKQANDAWYATLNDTPGLVGPPIERCTLDVVPYFQRWLERDGYPFWPFWENVRSWWEIRHLPNVLFIHFDALKKNLAEEMRRIAAFLDAPVTEARWPTLIEHCTFAYMKTHAELSAPLGGMLWEGGAQTFINKGTNGRWRDRLAPVDVAAYEAQAEAELGTDCAHWLATGEMLS